MMFKLGRKARLIMLASLVLTGLAALTVIAVAGLALKGVFCVFGI